MAVAARFSYPHGQDKTLPVTGEFSFDLTSHQHKGNTTMNTLHFICVLLLTLLIPTTLFASSLKVFFTDDELAEMGVGVEHAEDEVEGAAACSVPCPSG